MELAKKAISVAMSLVMAISLSLGLVASTAYAKAPSTISLSRTSVSIKVGSKVALKVKSVKPSGSSKKVSWKSSNSKVVSVGSNGVLKAKKAGTATITAKAKNGKAVGKCKVKVVKKSSEKRKTSGKSLNRGTMQLARFNSAAALTVNNTKFDVSSLSQGYVGALAKSQTRLKLEVAKGGLSMYYDMPSNGTPVLAPLSMGNGAYTFSIWENTSGQKYARLSTTSANVSMASEFQPFLVNNIFCDYDQNSNAAKLAANLAKNASNEGDLLAEVYDWVVGNISYDTAKAKQLSGKSGYVPDPDSTISSKKGICFDYSSLVAAMLRSQGIPCKIITGDVAPNNVYHAWNMAYIDGTWVSTYIDVKSRTWTRLDTTFAAGGADSAFVGNGSNYSDRYVY